MHVQRIVQWQSAGRLRKCQITSSYALASSQCRAASSVSWRYGSRCRARFDQSWISCAKSTAGHEFHLRVQNASHRPSRGLNVPVNSLFSPSALSRGFSTGTGLSYPTSSNSTTPPPQRVDVVSTFLCLDPPTPTQSSSHPRSNSEVLSNFRIALLKRRPDRSVYASKWAVVSGKVETKHAELPLEAAVREVYEETGLVVDTGTYTNTYTNTSTSINTVSRNTKGKGNKQYTARLLLIGTPYDIADEQINKIWRIHPFLVQVLWRDGPLQDGPLQDRPLQSSSGAPLETPSEASGPSEGNSTGGPQAETDAATKAAKAIKAATSLIHLDTTENGEIRFVALDDMHRYDTVDGLEGTARTLVGEYLRMKI